MSIDRIRRALGLALALLAAQAWSPPAAMARPPQRLGIVVSVAVNISPTEARTIAGEVGEALSRKLRLDIIAGEETERRLPPQGLPDDCLADASCRHDLGQRLDADELLFLVMVRLGTTIQIDSTWADVASGEVLSRPRVMLEQGEDRAAFFAAAAARLVPHSPPATAPSPREIVVLSPPPTTPSRTIPTGSLIGGGVGAAALLGATVFALSARQKFHSLSARGCQTSVCPSEDVASLRRHALTADILFAVSGAAAATAAVLYWTSNRAAARERPPAGARLEVGPGGLYLVWRGVY